MKLYKDGMVKELTSEKVVNRWIKFGWTADETPVAPVENAPIEISRHDHEISEPVKRRGRPAKAVDNGNA